MTQSYNFLDAEIVRTNRQGQVTQVQRENLEAAVLVVFSTQGVALMVGLIVLAIVAFAGTDPSVGLAPWLAWPCFGAVMLGYTGFVAWRARGAWLARRELNAGKIAWGEGTFQMEGKAYVARVEGRKLHLPGRVNLLPGQYRFYFLEQSRWVISGELGAEPNEMDLLQALARTNAFTLEMLAANRAGALAQGQAGAIYRRLLAGAAPIALTSGGVAVSVALLSAAFWPRSTGAWTLFVLGMGTAATLVALAVLVGPQLLTAARDIRGGRAYRVEAVGHKQHIARYFYGYTFHAYYYHIGAVTSPVTRAGYEALVEGWRYRLYYLPESQVLTAIEPLPRK